MFQGNRLDAWINIWKKKKIWKKNIFRFNTSTEKTSALADVLLTCFVRIQSIYTEVHGTENSAIAHQTSPSLEDKTHLLWHSVVLPVQYLMRWEKERCVFWETSQGKMASHLNSLSYERLCTKTRFETVAKGKNGLLCPTTLPNYWWIFENLSSNATHPTNSVNVTEGSILSKESLFDNKIQKSQSSFLSYKHKKQKRKPRCFFLRATLYVNLWREENDCYHFAKINVWVLHHSTVSSTKKGMMRVSIHQSIHSVN